MTKISVQEAKTVHPSPFLHPAVGDP